MTLRTIIVLLFVFSIGTIGCSQMSKKETETGMVPSPTPLSSGLIESENPSPSPVITQESTKKKLKKDRFPSRANPKKEKAIVINDPLLDLSEEEFKRIYNKLPDDYEIKIGMDHTLFHEFVNSNPEKPFKWYLGFDGILTKKQAERIRTFTTFNNEDRVVDKYVINMKGLRFFPNIKTVKLHNSGLCNIEELGYLSKLSEVILLSCNLGIGKSTNKLKGLSKMKKLDITIHQCRLKNLNFLNELPEIKNVKYLGFSHNQIKNISPLRRVENVSRYIDLSNNRISDISPLSNIKQINELWLENNRISNIKALSGLKEIRTLDMRGNRITDLSPIKNLKAKGNSKGRFNFTNNCVLDYSPVEALLNNSHRAEREKIQTDTLFYECMKWHCNVKIQGKEYREDEKTKFFFYFKYGKYREPLQRDIDPACNILLFFNSIGGFGSYDKKDGVLRCNYQGNSYIFRDFEKTVSVNGREKIMKYEMKHMQGNQPYATVLDLCMLIGKQYQIKETRTMWIDNFSTREIPSLVEVS
jgi:hypothetical protein